MGQWHGLDDEESKKSQESDGEEFDQWQKDGGEELEQCRKANGETRNSNWRLLARTVALAEDR